jgi:phosphate transport system permease protein
MTALTSPPREPTSPRRAAVRRGDRVFRGLTLAAGVFTLIVLAAIAIFLIVKALPALRADTKGFLTTREWLPDASPSVFGIAALAFGTLLSSALALVIAVPIAIGVALYTTDYAPRRIATVLGYVTDMLAAVPSVIYGLWGLYFLIPHLVPVQSFLARTFGWIPLFADPDNRTSVASRSIFAAAVVLAVMILPIISAISREVLAQVPTTNREAALALGATRWEMIRTAVLPPSRPGLISAVMLGLGRALGETIAVALVLAASFDVNWRVLTPGGNSIAANIATKFGESGNTGRESLIASGLVLFAITLIVNLVARAVIYRSGAMERSAAV